MCADIVGIGAGPVGLWVASQTKKQKPGLDIQLYERHQQYERSHVLRLEYLSMLLYSIVGNDPSEKRFFEDITGMDIKELILRAALMGYTNPRTNELEEALKTHAADLGIKTTYEKISGIDEAEERHPECSRFVGADGAHSRIREELLGEDCLIEQSLQHVVELKYQAEGDAGRLSLGRAFHTNCKLDSMAFEYVGREKCGTTPVTVRFFVDQDTYNVLPEASFREPLRLHDPRIPESLAKDIDAYLEVRKARAHETYAEGSGKMSKLTLSVYAARKFAAMHGDKAWFLAGDAALGVPYFRSLNAGMIVGSQLAQALASDTLNNEGRVAIYNLVRPLDISWEFVTAYGKNAGLGIYDVVRKVGSLIPTDAFKPR